MVGIFDIVGSILFDQQDKNSLSALLYMTRQFYKDQHHVHFILI